MTGLLLAEAAEELTGSPFRLHGRDAATGLDCIGLLHAALCAIGRVPHFPTGYSIRTESYFRLPALAREHGFVAAHGPVAPGDVLFTRSGPGQLHLQIITADGLARIEAHAGIGRVVRTPGQSCEPLIHSWRLDA